MDHELVTLTESAEEGAPQPLDRDRRSASFAWSSSSTS